ncbi:hypothetical protein LY76DRAFT_656082 [Colletotrichum caudatum]|nr:hypothetical protein LY76DRAFT_656082 [Colletotrichum caudatum]
MPPSRGVTRKAVGCLAVLASAACCLYSVQDAWLFLEPRYDATRPNGAKQSQWQPWAAARSDADYPYIAKITNSCRRFLGNWLAARPTDGCPCSMFETCPAAAWLSHGSRLVAPAYSHVGPRQGRICNRRAGTTSSCIRSVPDPSSPKRKRHTCRLLHAL